LERVSNVGASLLANAWVQAPHYSLMNNVAILPVPTQLRETSDGQRRNVAGNHVVSSNGLTLRPSGSAILGATKSTSGGTLMAHIVLSHVVASISELKKNPMGTVAAGGGRSVAILNRNEPAFYCVPAKEYEAMMTRLDDLELIALCKERENDPTIKVSIDNL
jgi:antitoxin StbD